jgi:hypothetical protein
MIQIAWVATAIDLTYMLRGISPCLQPLGYESISDPPERSRIHPYTQYPCPAHPLSPALLELVARHRPIRPAESHIPRHF